jgi:integrase
MLYEAVERLDALMAIGEKRGRAKAEARARGEQTFSFTDQRIHSFQTRSTYQDVIMRFLKWCRVHFGLNRLADIDVCADELSCAYLEERITQQYSAWTLRTERAALRLFFQRRDLAASVVLPPRHLNAITRSRHPVARDRHIQPEHWRSLIDFCLGCGLRREEVRDVRVQDVYRRRDGVLVVQVVRGKGGKWREAPVLPEQEAQILAVIAGRKPEERIFPHLPEHLDIHSCRRTYAQHLYQHLSGHALPAVSRPLQMSEVDLRAALQVSQALGHERIDVVILYYLK